MLLGVLAVALALYLADLGLNRGNVPRGTTVGGVAIGGMAPGEAQEKLEQELIDAPTRPLSIRAAEQDAVVVPAEAGLSVDFPATIEAAGIESANPFSRLVGLFREHEVDAVTVVDEALLAPQLDRVQRELHVEPVDGVIRVEGGEAAVDKPKLGQDVPRDRLRDELTAGWLNPDGVDVEPDELQPAINDEVVTAAMDGPVKAALSGPLTLTGRGQGQPGDPEGGDAGEEVKATIPAERLGEIVQFPNVDGRIEPHVNYEAAGHMLGEQIVRTERPMQNARVLEGGGVAPAVDGSVIDWDATLKGFNERVLGGQPRDWDATYKDKPAEYTTEEAERATFNETVGSFTTGGFSGPSGTNIALVAATVNGAIVNPGETFSLNGYTGPRGTAQGYVSSGIILNGRADNAVGGGISQFATTLYNAAYFAGMTDVAHTPHSYFISRYPAGREATVYEGAIDLQFRNDSPYPVMISTSVGGGQVTVSLMGVNTVSVESVNGGRWAYTSPGTVNAAGAGCVPSSGSQGFTTSDTRYVYDLSGNLISSETQTTIYDPEPIVTCG
ncbi:hypothetical protein A0K93_02180 [Corynebacterium sp. BCW_4722]|nr:hypothetical protein A0K93_02180 [Corynebacterium sp. BCW_4722]